METDELQELANSILINGESRDLNKDPLTIDEVDAVLEFCRDQVKRDIDPDLKKFYIRVTDILLNEIKKVMH